MSNIVKFYPKNAAINPDAVLEQAIGQYENVFIIGFNKDGTIDPRASMGMDVEEVIYLLEKFKHKLFSGDYGE